MKTNFFYNSLLIALFLGCTTEDMDTVNSDEIVIENPVKEDANCTGETDSSNKNFRMTDLLEIEYIEEENNAFSGNFIFNDNKFICTGTLNEVEFSENGNIALFALNELFEVVWQFPKKPGRLYDVIHTSDNNYLAVGRFDDGDQSKIYVLKVDLSGNFIWEYSNTVTDENDLGAFATNVIESSEGGYLIAGKAKSNSNVFGFGDNSFVLKLSEDGEEQWAKPLSTNVTPSDCIINKKGNLVVIFNRSSDLIVNELNVNGDIVQEGSFGSSDLDGANHILQLANGNYILTGYTKGADGDVSETFQNMDIWVLKLDENLNLIKERSFGGFGYQIGSFMTELEDGTLLLVAEGSDNIIVQVTVKNPIFLRLTSDLCLIDWDDTDLRQDDYHLTDAFWNDNTKEITVFGNENDRSNNFDITDAFYFSLYSFQFTLQ